MRLRHGEHNEKLCGHLLHEAGDGFGDWVVTAAFYACIHFAEHALFPARMEGRHFADFDEYCEYRYGEKGDRQSKHSLKAGLVRTAMPRAGERYRWLKNMCMHARYKDYRTSRKKAEAAYRAMREIKQACLAMRGR